MSIVKVTEKGQVTIPIHLRRKLGIRKDDYVLVEEEEDYLKLRKVSATKALAPEDPIWQLVGKGSSGKKDVSRRHDHYLAEGERNRWRKS
jgi:AbrB family looped-hinge helix DNA binding protein